MSFGEFFNAFSALGDAYSEGQKKSALQALGLQLKNGDYSGAADTAFQAGDTTTGLKILGLGQQQQQSRDATAAFGALGSYMGAGGATIALPLRHCLRGARPIAPFLCSLAIPISRQGGACHPGERERRKQWRHRAENENRRPAYGAYQVMGANVGPWSEEVLGRR